MARARETHEQTVARLLAKTVARGATQPEQDAAAAKARELCSKWNLDPTGFEWPALMVEGRTGARTIRAICEELILRGVPTAEIVAAARAESGSTRTSPGCVAWYRSKMVKRNLARDKRGCLLVQVKLIWGADFP